MEAIVFPDVEQGLIDHLDALLTRPVVGKIPNPRPPRFTRIIRTGGPRSSLVTDGAQVTIESWAGTDTEAVADAQEVRAYINALLNQEIDGAVVSRVEEFSGPGNLPDPASAQARYVQTFRVHARGLAITES